MSTYIAQQDFIRKYVLRNARIRHGFVDISRALEESESRDMIGYLIASTWDGSPTSSTIPKPHKIAGLEGNGLAIATMVADRKDYPMVSIREKFQLAGEEGDIITVEYQNHEGKQRTIELRRSSVMDGFKPKSMDEIEERKPGIVIVDDLLRSGAKAKAAAKGIRMAGGRVLGLSVVAAIEDDVGLQLMEKEGIPVDYIVKVNMEKLKRGDYLREGPDTRMSEGANLS